LQEDNAAALAAHESGLAIRERVAKQDLSNTGWQRELATSYKLVGFARQMKGDLPDALAALQSDLAITERLTRQDPTNAMWQLDLSNSYGSIGALKYGQDDLPGALVAYESSLALRERLARQDPTNTEWQHFLGLAHFLVGTTRQQQGDFPAALTAFQEEREILERLLQQQPTNSLWNIELAGSHMMVGATRSAQGDFAGALSAYKISHDIIGRLEQQGDTLQAQGDLAGSLAAYEAATPILEPLVQMDPTNTEWQDELAMTHEKIATVHTALGNPAEALSALQASEKVAAHLDEQGDALQGKGDLPGALAAFEAGQTIRERLTQREPANTEWQRDLAISHGRIGSVRQLQKNLSGARTSFEKELEIAAKLFAKTNASEAPSFFGFVYDHLSTICYAQGDIPMALEYQRQLVAENRKRSDPSVLGPALLKLTTLEVQGSNVSAGLDTIREALAIARDLYAKQPDEPTKQFLAQVLNVQSFLLLVESQFLAAIAAAQEALTLNPNQTLSIRASAHGYLFSGQFKKAESIYRKHARDQVNGQKTFAEAVLDDFTTLRKQGIDHPDIIKIEALLKGNTPPAPTADKATN
jgi:tetratricopeptide (TPR) repeat protein